MNNKNKLLNKNKQVFLNLNNDVNNLSFWEKYSNILIIVFVLIVVIISLKYIIHEIILYKTYKNDIQIDADLVQRNDSLYTDLQGFGVLTTCDEQYCYINDGTINKELKVFENLSSTLILDNGQSYILCNDNECKYTITRGINNIQDILLIKRNASGIN